MLLAVDPDPHPTRAQNVPPIEWRLSLMALLRFFKDLVGGFVRPTSSMGDLFAATETLTFTPSKPPTSRQAGNGCLARPGGVGWPLPER